MCRENARALVTGGERLVEDASQLTDREAELMRILAAGGKADEQLAVLAELGVVQMQLKRLSGRIARRSGLPAGAKPRLLMYLRSRPNEVVDKDELSGVSGIYEWARRLRELRVEDGWRIASDQTRDDLRPGQYVLEADEPDLDLKERWHKANRIRRLKGSASDRLLEYLKASLGSPVSKDELRYVSGIQEHPRRLRELVEAGWQIDSNIDRPELRPGEYVMTSIDRLPSRARQAMKLRLQIIERDGARCRVCGQGAGAGRILQVHHITPLEDGGDDSEPNLETLCDACHAGKHALMGKPPQDELLRPDAEAPLAPPSGSNASVVCG